jgi:hypothetical protein
MATTVATRFQTLVITEISKIQITPIVDNSGTPTRAIRVWGSLGDTAPATIELILSAADDEDLRVTTPELEF